MRKSPVRVNLAPLLRVAARSGETEDLVATAAHALRRSIAVIGADGELVAAASGQVGNGSLAIHDLAMLTESHGWRTVDGLNSDLGFRIMIQGEYDSDGMASTPLLAMLCSGLDSRLRRGAMAEAMRAERQAALKRRLVTDFSISEDTVRREAAAAGLTLANAYWAALLTWKDGILPAEAATEVETALSARAADAIVVLCDRLVVVLVGSGGASTTSTKTSVQEWLAEAVRTGRAAAPELRIQAIVADRPAPVTEMPATLRSLTSLRRFLPLLSKDREVAPQGALALYQILREGLDRRWAAQYVRDRIGRLMDFDRAHGTDLAGTLEQALSHGRLSEAARAERVHRNTFRRHLRHAVDLVAADLDDPDDRLALQLALTVRHLG